MTETLRIEIPIETIDETSDGIDAAVRGLNKLSQAMKNSKSQVEQTEKSVSKFDKQAEKTEKSLAKWAKEKYEILLEAKDRISPILSTIGSGLKSFAGKTWSVTMRAVDLITSPVRGILNLLKNPIFQAGAVLGVSIGLKDTIDTYKDFEAAMSQVKAISGATSSEVAKLTDKAKEMGATTKFTAAESAEAFNYMAMAGWKTEDMLGGIDGILSLAAASGEDLATTSDIVTDALTAFNLKASDAGRFADVLAQASSNANTNVSMMGESFKYVAPVAGALKYSVEDVSLALGLMANASIKGSMSGTSLKTSLANLAAPTEKMQKYMDKYSISMTDSNGKMKTLRGLLDNLRSGLGGLAEAEQTAAASAIFGKEAMSGMLAIINASEEDYNKLAEAVNNADGASARMSETMMDNLEGSLIQLQSAVDGVKISFGERLSPYVRNLAEWLKGQMPAIEQGLNDFMDWIDKKVDRLQRKFKEISETKEWQDADFFGKVKISWNEFIAEPFKEWWSSTGKAKFAGFAQDIGEGIGTGLKLGIMTLLGIDLGETLDEGVSIGASFAKGFSEGFDFEAVSAKLWDGFKNLLSSAGKLLPGGKEADLSSLMSLALLAKIGSPLFKIGKGVTSLGKGLFGTNAASGTSIIGSLVGSTGNAMIGGTGILGKLSSIGYGISGGTYSEAAGMSGGMAALKGGGAVAGAVAGGATLISSAMDAYKAFKSDNEDEAKAYGESAAWKAGGVAAGAATGAAIGSIIPGLGTVVGALVGAGIGGIAGGIKGDKEVEEYEEEMEEMQARADKAKAVFMSAGMSIDDMTFKNKKLAQALQDSEVSAAEFAQMFQDECAKVAKDAFGDISLSLKEVKKLASEITFADMADDLEEFATTTAKTESSLNELQMTARALKKENWKIGLGLDLSETDKDSYKSTIESFVQASQTYIDDNHHEATVALRLLMGSDADTSGIDGYYNGIRSQIKELGDKLSESLNISLQDGVIELDEEKEMENLQKQIEDITSGLAEARTEAEFQALGVKYNGAAMDTDSFNAYLAEVQALTAEGSEQYYDAYVNVRTNLNWQKEKGLISDEQYQAALDEAEEKYQKQLDDMNSRVMSFGMESIATAYASKLGNIFPDFEGTIQERMTQGLKNAMTVHPDVENWLEDDIKSWMGLDKLNLDPTEQAAIAKDLINLAKAVPKGTREKIIKEFQNQLPTAEEIKAALDWDSMTMDDLQQLLVDFTGQEKKEPTGTYGRKTTSEYWGDNAVANQSLYAAMIAEYLKESGNQDLVTEFNSKYMGGSIDNFRTEMQIALDSAMEEPFQVAPEVLVNPNYKITPPVLSIPYSKSEAKTAFSSYSSAIAVDKAETKTASSGSAPAIVVGKKASGGFVSGGPQLSWLAEEGYGEFVIPTNPSRRARALDLYQQAGVALGVSAHADGGFVGGSILSDTASDYNLFAEANRNAPTAYNETNGESTSTYEPVSTEKEKTGMAPIQVQVSMQPEFAIHGGDGQSEEEIMQVIRKHMKEMADELGGEIAGKLEEVFSNMPLKEA